MPPAMPPLPSYLITPGPCVVGLLPFLVPAAALGGLLGGTQGCADDAACREDFFLAALDHLSGFDLSEATRVVNASWDVRGEASTDCSDPNQARFVLSESVFSLRGAPLAAANLVITVDGVPASATVTPLADGGAYGIRLDRTAEGGEVLRIGVPALGLASMCNGLVPALEVAVTLHDCTAPALSATVAGSDALPIQSAPKQSDGTALSANQLLLTFTEPVIGQNAEGGILASDLRFELSTRAGAPGDNLTFVLVAARVLPLQPAAAGQSRRLQGGLGAVQVGVELLLDTEPIGGEVVRITPLSLHDVSGNAVYAAAYTALLNGGDLPGPDAGISSSAGITTGAWVLPFACTSLQAGLLLLVSVMLTHGMLFGAGALLPYVARAEHAVRFGESPPKHRFAPRWGPAVWASTLVLTVAFLPLVSLGYISGMTYMAAMWPLWLMYLLIFRAACRRARKQGLARQGQVRVDMGWRERGNEALPALLAALHTGLGLLVCAIADFPLSFTAVGTRLVPILVVAASIILASALLVISQGPPSGVERKSWYKRTLARDAIGILLLVAVVTLSAIRPDWDAPCSGSWAWILLPLLFTVGLLFLHQLMQRFLRSCFTAQPGEPGKKLSLRGFFMNSLPKDFEPTDGAAKLTFHKVISEAVRLQRPVLEVAAEMLQGLREPAFPAAVLSAVGDEFGLRHGRAPTDATESVRFLKSILDRATEQRARLQELEDALPENALAYAHGVLREIDLSADPADDTLALQTLSDHLAIFAADGMGSKPEQVLLKRAVDDLLRARTQLAEAAIPAGIAFALAAEFGQMDGGGAQGDQLEVLELCTQLVSEYNNTAAALAENPNAADAHLPLGMGLDLAAGHEFTMKEVSDPCSTVERLSFRKSSVTEDKNWQEGAVSHAAAKKSVQETGTFSGKETRPAHILKAARPAPVLNSGISPEAQEQVMEAVNRMVESEEADRRSRVSWESSAGNKSGPATHSERAAAAVPAIVLGLGLAITIAAGVIAGVVGSGSSAPTAAVAIAVSLGAAATASAAFVAYRISRFFRKKRLKALQEQLKRSSLYLGRSQKMWPASGRFSSRRAPSPRDRSIVAVQGTLGAAGVRSRVAVPGEAGPSNYHSESEDVESDGDAENPSPKSSHAQSPSGERELSAGRDACSPPHLLERVPSANAIGMTQAERYLARVRRVSGEDDIRKAIASALHRAPPSPAAPAVPQLTDGADSPLKPTGQHGEEHAALTHGVEHVDLVARMAAAKAIAKLPAPSASSHGRTSPVHPARQPARQPAMPEVLSERLQRGERRLGACASEGKQVLPPIQQQPAPPSSALPIQHQPAPPWAPPIQHQQAPSIENQPAPDHRAAPFPEGHRPASAFRAPASAFRAPALAVGESSVQHRAAPTNQRPAGSSTSSPAQPMTPGFKPMRKPPTLD